MRDINFSALPIFSGLDRVDLAKLIPSFVCEEHSAGAILFRQGDQGESLYIVVRGMVRVLLHHSQGEREVASLGEGQCLGEMALLTGEPRTADCVAATDIAVLRLDKKDFDEILAKHATLAVHFAALVASRAAASTTRKSCGEGPNEPPRKEVPAASSDLDIDAPRHRLLRHPKLVTLLVTALLCAASTCYLASQGIARDHIVLIELLLAATIIWSFDIVSYHAVSLALPLAAVLFHIAKPDKAFAGFSKSSWFMALGVFALMAAISKTGLLYRLSLQVLRRFPPHYLGQASALALAGLLLTPMIPSSNGRAILASPIALTLTETLRLEKGGKGSVGIAMACLLGFGHMSFMFMNGTATCLFVMGLMPPDVAASITWGSWFKAALPFGLIFFAISLASIFILFHPREMTRLNPEVIDAQLGTLGPVTFAEKITLVTGVISLIGFATVSWHGIDEGWVAMLCFLFLFATTVLDDHALKEMDWSFL
ncbi:MAG: SLC13 family permease, partial [Desulfuromonadales bacterium]